MAIKFNRTQTFATNGTVSAPSLHNLVDSLDIYQSLITDQTNATSVSTADELLIAIAAGLSGDAPKAVTVQELFQDALTAGTYTNANISEALTYGTATGTRLVSTNATITTGTITTGVIPTLTSSTATFGTTTSTAATITSGTVTNLASTTGTIATFNSTTGTIATLNSTTGTIGTLNSTTGTIGTLNSTTGTIGNFTTTLVGDFTISNGTGTLGTTGVTAGTYGTSTIIPRITVDSKGRITSVGTSAIGSLGKVLQVAKATTASVITCGTTIPWDDTIPQITEGNEVLAVTITPLSATSTIYLKFDASGSSSSAVVNAATAAIFKDSTTNAIYATQIHFWNALNYGIKFVASYSEASGGTAARTYRIRIGSDTPTIYINGNSSGVRRYGGVSIAQFEAWEVES